MLFPRVLITRHSSHRLNQVRNCLGTNGSNIWVIFSIVMKNFSLCDVDWLCLDHPAMVCSACGAQAGS